MSNFIKLCQIYYLTVNLTQRSPICTVLGSFNRNRELPILNPYSDFGVHYMVKINGKYYDPSYGARFDSLKDWEEASVAGYYVWERMSHPDTGNLILYLYFRKNELNETTIIEEYYGH